MLAATTESNTKRRTAPTANTKTKPRKQPPYNVILYDDDDHSYEYVIGMLRKLFGFAEQRAYILACQVDSTGNVIVETTSFERAEFKRDQIHAFGRDWRIPRCEGSMTASIEPVE